MVNRREAVVSFALNVFQQLQQFSTYSSIKPNINALIGTRGSRKTTFGTCWLNSLVELTNNTTERAKLHHYLNNKCNESKILDILDFLVYLYLSNRFIAMELPMEGFENSKEYLLYYIAKYVNISVDSDLFDVPDLYDCMKKLLSLIAPTAVISDWCCFSNDNEALKYWQSIQNNETIALPFLFFFDELPNSSTPMIDGWFPVFYQLVSNRIGVPFVAGLSRQFIDKNLTNSKFLVKTYRLDAIASLQHLQMFLNYSNLKDCSYHYDRKEALKCLINCAGNPRVIVCTIENFRRTGKWIVTIPNSNTHVGVNNPLTNALSLAAMPLGLSASDTVDCDRINYPTSSISMDQFETNAQLMFSPFVVPPPKRSRKSTDEFVCTRYHCILSRFDFSISDVHSIVDIEMISTLKKLVDVVVEMFDEKNNCHDESYTKNSNGISQVTLNNCSSEFGSSLEDLIGYFLIMRSKLLSEIVSTNRSSLVYLFGPCHTSCNPDGAPWMKSEYGIELRQGLAKLLPISKPYLNRRRIASKK
ncbi:hypothetical protein GEMRC1_007976 [Eukaryota sp. GEM-RC1]